MPASAETGKNGTVILSTPRQYFEVVDELSNTERGENGFGSTDKENSDG